MDELELLLASFYYDPVDERYPVNETIREMISIMQRQQAEIAELRRRLDEGQALVLETPCPDCEGRTNRSCYKCHGWGEVLTEDGEKVFSVSGRRQ